MSTLQRKISTVKKTSAPAAAASNSAPTVVSDAVKVYARVRPLGKKAGPQSSLEILGNYINTTAPAEGAGGGARPDQGKKRFEFEMCFESGKKSPGQGQEDQVFSSEAAEAEAGQREVFAHLGPPMLDAALSGYNACLMAYGQTGSGKTHTMMGSGGGPAGGRSSGGDKQQTAAPAATGEKNDGEEQDGAESTSSDDDDHQPAADSPEAAAGLDSSPAGASAGVAGFIPRFVESLFHSIQKTQRRETTHKVPRPPSTLGSAGLAAKPTEPTAGDGSEQHVDPAAAGSESGVLPPTSAVAPPNTTVTFRVHARYFELYNEKAYDLLPSLAAPATPTSKLSRTRDGKISRQPTEVTAEDAASAVPQGVRREVKVRDNEVIEGLTEHLVTSPETILALLAAGDRQRSVGATNKNERSSRSHAVFQLKVTKHILPVKASAPGSMPSSQQQQQSLTVVSRVSLVDLAGSERQKASGAEGDRFKEMVNINQSLTTLRRVITHLHDYPPSVKGNPKPPVRDSLLTKALGNCFGGNSRTMLLLNVSPDPADLRETLSTLEFSSIAKRVVNETSINMDQTSRMMKNMNDEISKLKARLEAEAIARKNALDQLERERSQREELQSQVLNPTPRPADSNCSNMCVGTTTEVAPNVEGRWVSKNEEETREGGAKERMLEQLEQLDLLKTTLENQQEEHYATVESMSEQLARSQEEVAGCRMQVTRLRSNFQFDMRKYFKGKKKFQEALKRVTKPLKEKPDCAQCQASAIELSHSRLYLETSQEELDRMHYDLEVSYKDQITLTEKVGTLNAGLAELQDRLVVANKQAEVVEAQKVRMLEMELQLETYVKDRISLTMELWAVKAVQQDLQKKLIQDSLAVSKEQTKAATATADTKKSDSKEVVATEESPIEEKGEEEGESTTTRNQRSSLAGSVIDVIGDLGFESEREFRAWFGEALVQCPRGVEPAAAAETTSRSNKSDE